jgi:cation diffusion facilitator CzcD-associated flavoprotein CzcO
VREQPNAKGRWTVVSEQSGRRMEEGFDLLVVATGLYSGRPHLPAFPGQEHFRGQVLHVSQVRSRDQLQERKVVVVGYGKSATDVALESAAVADNTTMVFREPHWPVPPRLLGILPFKWAMLSRLTSALIPPYYRASRAERVAHSLGRPLVWLWWRLVELLLIGQCKLGSRFGTRVSLVPSQPVEIDTFGEAVMLPRPEFFNVVRNGGIQARRTEIARFTESGVILATGETLEADVVVMGTGWRTSYAYLPADVRARIGFEPDGFYLYRHMVPAQVPGLVFIGSASTIESIATYSLQARWLIELIQGTHGLPSGPEMQRDVEEVKAWKRRWMPFSPARGARLLLHMLHYHDQLLADMGIESRRKQGAFAPFKEVFAPYQPSDYRSVAAGDEEAAATGLRQRGNTATDRAA